MVNLNKYQQVIYVKKDVVNVADAINTQQKNG